MGLGIPLERFKEKPPPWAICKVCNDVAKEPTQGTCEHVFCKECLPSTTDEQSLPKCPTCMDDFCQQDVDLVRNGILRNQFYNMLIYCENRVRTSAGYGGCEIVESLAELKDHMERCEAKVCCPLILQQPNDACNHLIMKKDVGDHSCNRSLLREASELKTQLSSQKKDLTRNEKEVERVKKEAAALKKELEQAKGLVEELKLEKKKVSDQLGRGNQEREEYMSFVENSELDENVKMKFAELALKCWAKSFPTPEQPDSCMWAKVAFETTSDVLHEVKEALKEAGCPPPWAIKFVSNMKSKEGISVLREACQNSAKYNLRSLRDHQLKKNPDCRFYLALQTDNEHIKDPKMIPPFPGLVIRVKRR